MDEDRRGPVRRRVLVLRALGLGDFLTGVPALRAVRRALPDAELVLAAPAALTPLVSLAEVATCVLPASGLDDELGWSGPPPEVAVNLHGRGPRSHRLLQRLEPGRLVAFGCGEADVPGPQWRADEPEVARWCRLVASRLGADADPSDLHLAAPEQPPLVAGAVVVHPGAAFASRRWPAERFAAVARWAGAQGWPVTVTGSADERTLACEVRRQAGLAETDVLAGRTDLAELAAVVASARLVICGDTGMAHLASAFGTPSVVLFGPVSPAFWGPPDTGPHSVLWHGDGTGDPFGSDLDPALARITVAEVLQAASRTVG